MAFLTGDVPHGRRVVEPHDSGVTLGEGQRPLSCTNANVKDLHLRVRGDHPCQSLEAFETASNRGL